MMLAKISGGVFPYFSFKGLKFVSDCSKDFIEHLLEVDVESRFSALEALEHSWLQGYSKEKSAEVAEENKRKGMISVVPSRSVIEEIL